MRKRASTVSELKNNVWDPRPTCHYGHINRSYLLTYMGGSEPLSNTEQMPYVVNLSPKTNSGYVLYGYLRPRYSIQQSCW